MQGAPATLQIFAELVAQTLQIFRDTLSDLRQDCLPAYGDLP